MEHPDQHSNNAQQAQTSDPNQAFRAARRQMIKSAVAAVPVVLTVAAGTAHAQASGSNPMSGGAGLQGGGFSPEQGGIEQQLDNMLDASSADTPSQLNRDGSVPSVE